MKVFNRAPPPELSDAIPQFSPGPLAVGIPSSVFVKKIRTRQLGVSLLNKVFVWFEACFWDKEVHAFGYVPPEGACGGRFSEIVNCLPLTGQPILMALVGPPYAPLPVLVCSGEMGSRAAHRLNNAFVTPSRRIDDALMSPCRRLKEPLSTP